MSRPRRPALGTFVTLDIEIPDVPRWYALHTARLLSSERGSSFRMKPAVGNIKTTNKNQKVVLYAQFGPRYIQDFDEVLDRIDYIRSYSYTYTIRSTGRSITFTKVKDED